MSHPLLEGLDGLTGAALRQRLVEARAAALASAAGDAGHPMTDLVRDVEYRVVQAMRAGITALVQGMQPLTAEEPVPAPAPRPPMVRVPAPAAAAVPTPVPAPRPQTPSKLAGLKRPAPAEDGPPEAPEPVPRHPPIRPPLPRVQPLPGHRPPPPPPPIDPNDNDIPW